MHILILYGSLTGNTQLLAEHLFEYLTYLHHTVSLKDQSEADIAQLHTYDLVCICASTWGEGEANPTTQFFIEALQSSSEQLACRCVFVGLGDRAYEHFCRVVDLLEAAFLTRCVKPLAPSIRLEGFPDELMWEQVDPWLCDIVLPELHTVLNTPRAD